MKTRFDYENVWITGSGEAVSVVSMTTPHLLDTVKILLQKPARVLSILVSDIESAAFYDTVWAAHNMIDSKKSLKNITSLSESELVEYVKTTPLFNSMLTTLSERGVDVDNIIKLYSSSEAFFR